MCEGLQTGGIFYKGQNLWHFHKSCGPGLSSLTLLVPLPPLAFQGGLLRPFSLPSSGSSSSFLLPPSSTHSSWVFLTLGLTSHGPRVPDQTLSFKTSLLGRRNFRHQVEMPAQHTLQSVCLPAKSTLPVATEPINTHHCLTAQHGRFVIWPRSQHHCLNKG